MALTAFEIRQAFIHQDRLKHIFYAFFFINYTTYFNKMMPSIRKTSIKIKKSSIINFKPNSIHEVVQKILFENNLSTRIYATSLSPLT